MDGSGEANISSGVGFFDHMLTALTKHSSFNLRLKCEGDLEVDDHHSVEDCAIALGEAINKCLMDKKGIKRFASAYAPLDEALARAVVDISGRGGFYGDLNFNYQMIGDLSSENVKHFFQTLAENAKITLHLDLIRGENDHHKAEACFKALAIALKSAVKRGDLLSIPSTKGVL